jgi:lysophospholipase L1-like esterase
MTDPFVNPLRVTVFGNSVGLLVAGRCESKGPYLTYPAALSRATSRGKQFDVTNQCRVAGVLTRVSDAWLRPLASTRPDVVVLQFGGYDALPRWVPRRLTAILMGISRHPGRLRSRFWRAAGRLLGLLSLWECKVDRVIPVGVGGYVSPKRFEAELRHVCRQMLGQIGCRVVLMDAYGPASNSALNTPNVLARIAANNTAIRKVAGELGLEVFPLDAVVTEMGRDEVLKDGIHMHHDANVRVGEELADFLTRPFA